MTISDKLEPLFVLSSNESVCGTLFSELRHAKSRPYGKMIGKISDTKALASNDRHGARKTRTVSETSKTDGSEVCDHERVLARPSRRRAKGVRSLSKSLATSLRVGQSRKDPRNIRARYSSHLSHHGYLHNTYTIHLA